MIVCNPIIVKKWMNEWLDTFVVGLKDMEQPVTSHSMGIADTSMGIPDT